MRKQYTLEPARIMDIQGDASKYLPIAMYAIGCHMGEMTEQELTGLVHVLMVEMRKREESLDLWSPRNPDQNPFDPSWNIMQNAAYCEGHDFT